MKKQEILDLIGEKSDRHYFINTVSKGLYIFGHHEIKVHEVTVEVFVGEWPDQLLIHLQMENIRSMDIRPHRMLGEALYIIVE